MNKTPQTWSWAGGIPTQVPLQEGDRVRVSAYGLGAVMADIGRIGRVTRINRTRVVVVFDNPREGSCVASRTVSGECLTLVTL